MVSLETIQNLCRGRISFSEPLAPLTSFRIGGPADCYLEPESTEDLLQITRYFRSQNFPFIIIGNGSNILVSDEGYRGAVINLEHGFTYIRRESGLVVAGAGIRMSKFVDFCIEEELSGVEMLAGIPGTLGGAVIMNAGAYGGEISEHLQEVTLVRDDTVRTLSKEQAGFRYRASDLERDIILEARFRLEGGRKEELTRRRREVLRKRNASQPTIYPNAGSIFKNPPADFAARLIEEAGLKGLRIGGAEISQQHANFIINTGGAKAEDVVGLMRRIREVVEERFQLLLEPEVKLIGFRDDVLHPAGEEVE